jgi:hypothetical protein
MSCPSKLKRKWATYLLITFLVSVLALNVYAVTYDVIYTQNLYTDFHVQFTIGSTWRFQLDSGTYMEVMAVTDVNADSRLLCSKANGLCDLTPTGTMTVKITWFGNVTQVQWNIVDIVNGSTHSSFSGVGNVLSWNWGFSEAPPGPASYELKVGAYDLNSSSLFSLEFLLNGTSTTTPYTGLINANDTEEIAMPFEWPDPTNGSWAYQFVNWADGSNSTSREYYASDNATLTANYVLVPYNPTPLLLPIPFIIGMVGLGCLFVGPMYGISLLRKKEYKNGLIWGVIFTAVGFALFISWLWGVA